MRQRPVHAWIGFVLGAASYLLGDSGSVYCRYFERRFVSALPTAHLDGRADYSRALFALVMCDAWYEPFMARATEALP